MFAFQQQDVVLQERREDLNLTDLNLKHFSVFCFNVSASFFQDLFKHFTNISSPLNQFTSLAS